MATLNPQPAIPEEREKQHLPPKSYADAVEEEAPASTHEPPAANGHNGKSPKDALHNDAKDSLHNGAQDANGTKDRRTIGDPVGHTASVLRIVGTDAEVKEVEKEKKKKKGSEEKRGSQEKRRSEEKEEGKDKENGRPLYERQESKHEYSATGIDDAPRTPPRKRHRKTPSQKSNSTHTQETLTTEEKILGLKHQNGDSTPKETNQNTTVFEKVSGQHNGSKLISIKPSANYEKQLQRDRKELASGRTPGQRWGESAIRFAPMNVPLQRRLQTLVVLFHVLCIALFVSAFFFLCAIPLFWPLLIPYMIYCMASKASTSGTLSYRSDFLRSLPVWSLFASYFPARLHRTQELPPTRKYIFGYHPHGIISMGAFAAFGTEALGFSQLFPGIKNTLLTLDSNFRIPIYRDYALAMGLASVSKESCENLLSKGGPNKEGMGRAITIVIGGARESLDAHPYSLRLVLARRKGFVKMAIRTGADLVPVLAFGENDLYDQFGVESHPKIHKIQLLVKKLLGFTIPLFHARGVFNYDVGLMPYRRPVNVVVGRPVRVEQMKVPDQETIDRVHEEYVRELERLWDLWKDEFAKGRKGELEILE